MPPRNHYDEDDLDPRDAPYERFGEQGLGLSTYAIDPPRPSDGDHRADERIRENLVEQLAAHRAMDGSHVEPSVMDGHVTLEGRVPFREARELAEAIAAAVPGVIDVENRLRVTTLG